MRRLRHLMVAASATAAAIAVGDATPTAADGGIRALGTVMTGAAERSGPGDPDGIGVAGLVVDTNRGRICYILAVRKIAPATAAHIHAAPADTFGDVVVTLETPNARGFSADCEEVDPTLAGQIAAMPSQFYVNVHTADFPGGAVRGQLG